MGFQDPALSCCTYLIGAASGLIGNLLLGQKFDQKSNALNASQKNHKVDPKAKKSSSDPIQDLLKRMRVQYRVEMGGS